MALRTLVLIAVCLLHVTGGGHRRGVEAKPGTLVDKSVDLEEIPRGHDVSAERITVRGETSIFMATFTYDGLAGQVVFCVGGRTAELTYDEDDGPLANDPNRYGPTLEWCSVTEHQANSQVAGDPDTTTRILSNGTSIVREGVVLQAATLNLTNADWLAIYSLTSRDILGLAFLNSDTAAAVRDGDEQLPECPTPDEPEASPTRCYPNSGLSTGILILLIIVGLILVAVLGTAVIWAVEHYK